MKTQQGKRHLFVPQNPDHDNHSSCGQRSYDHAETIPNIPVERESTHSAR